MTPFLILADIPIFDWQGPAFLMFYAAAYLGAVALTIRLGDARLKRFSARGEPPEPDDPFDVAYLAGGAPRALKLAVGRLIHLGLIVWTKKWTGDRLLATGRESSEALHPLETIILTRVLGTGKDGLKVKQVAHGCFAPLSSIASRLAFAGLRPTEQELKNSSLSCVWPLPLLLVIGIIKMFIGISRHRPIGFLMIALGITFFSIFIMAGVVIKRGGRLTPAGTDVLGRLKARHPAGTDTQPDLQLWSMGLALGSMFAMSGVPEIDSMYQTLNRHPMFIPGNGNTSGCGTSGCGGGASSCGGGGSSCGGGGGSCSSGCGGCGGGGGD